MIYDYTPEELQMLLDTSHGYKDVLRKIGYTGHGGNTNTLHRIIKEYGLDETQMDINRTECYRDVAKQVHEYITIPVEKIIFENYPYHSNSRLYNKLINAKYKEKKCEICGITSWQNKPISLQLHHKDGNHNNNLLENLQVLCPNCHSQTDTFAGKRKNDIKKKEKIKKQIKHEYKERKKMPVSREDLKNMIRTTPFVEIAKEFNVTDNAVRKWCDRYKLPRKVSVIKQISDEEWELI